MPQAFFSLEVLVLHGSVLLQNRSNKMHLPKNSSIRFPSLPMIIEKNGSNCNMARAKVMEKKNQLIFKLNFYTMTKCGDLKFFPLFTRDGPTPWLDVQIWTPLQFFWAELECTTNPNHTTVVGVGTECAYWAADWGGTHSFQLLLQIS